MKKLFFIATLFSICTLNGSETPTNIQEWTGNPLGIKIHPGSSIVKKSEQNPWETLPTSLSLFEKIFLSKNTNPYVKPIGNGHISRHMKKLSGAPKEINLSYEELELRNLHQELSELLGTKNDSSLLYDPKMRTFKLPIRITGGGTAEVEIDFVGKTTKKTLLRRFKNTYPKGFVMWKNEDNEDFEIRLGEALIELDNKSDR